MRSYITPDQYYTNTSAEVFEVWVEDTRLGWIDKGEYIHDSMFLNETDLRNILHLMAQIKNDKS